jgi:hypothetical protein
MALWYIINSVTLVQPGGNLQKFLPGAVVNDAQFSVASINSVGGALWPATDPVVTPFALLAQARHTQRSLNEAELESIMRSGVQTAMQAGGGLSVASGIVADTGRAQGTATKLTADINRVDTSTAPVAGTVAGDGVLLPAATAVGGITRVINNTANPIQVFPSGTDTINGLAASAPVAVPPGDVAEFHSAGAGAWQFEAGVGSAGALPVQLACDTFAALGTTQGTAAPLVADITRVTSATQGVATGILLPPAKAGLDLFVVNHSGTPLNIFATGTDTVDDVNTSVTAVPMMDSSLVLFICTSNGKWYTEGLGTGYARNASAGVVLQTLVFADGITAAGATQGTATPMVASINNVTTVGVATPPPGVNLPVSAPGLSIMVQNNSANPLSVYPAQSEAAATINGGAGGAAVVIHQGTVATFNCTTAGAWTVEAPSPVNASFSTLANADANVVMTAAQATGAVGVVVFKLTGAITAGRNLTTPTAAQLLAGMHSPAIGTTYVLRILNAQAGAFAFTLLGGTNVTVNGTATINQNQWRDFLVQVTGVGAGAAITMTSLVSSTGP